MPITIPGVGSCGQSRRSVVGLRLALDQFCEAEVEDLDPAVFGDEQILRLEVAMNDAFVVRCRQSVSDLDGVIECFANRHRAALQQLPQCAALQQLGDQIGCAFKDAELVNREDVGMVECCGGLGFVLEAQQPVGIARNERRQDLDRDFPF